MKHLFIALLCLVLFVPATQAAPSSYATYFTFSAPVSLPGVTLPAGTYLATTSTPLAGSDEAVASEIAKQIRQYPFYTIYDDVEGSVQDGVVHLTGKVTMPFKASDIAKRVARVPGVREVDNRIQTLPVSAFDDELRARIARQIYGDPMFWNYAIQVNPPIHVIVEHGRVTLTGAVGSEVERLKAEMVARTTPNVFGVENKLQVETGSES